MLRQRRWALNVSMGECAAYLGLDLLKFLNKELGRESFSEAEIAKLATLLQSSPNVLIAEFNDCGSSGDCTSVQHALPA